VCCPFAPLIRCRVGFFDFLTGGGSGKKSVKRSPISRWDLRGRTGQGSMSKVYQAYDNSIGRVVCLKLLDKDKTKKFEERFKGLKKPSEGEICLGLSHQNCVKTYEHGKIEKTDEPYLVMEWIEGVGLNYLVETKNKQLDGNRVNYLGQLADALQYMHDNKWLHRDLCPRNIMVDKDGVLKLIDFGLTIPYTPPFCAPGNRTGTAEYLAPELVKRRSTNHKVDLYALGITAYEVFTFAMPWDRSPNSEENFRRRLNIPPRNPKDHNPRLDDATCKFLLKSISREPADRFASASDFKAELEKLSEK
jgi:eukaryotic-like serine/threonine-protein kinase